MNNLFPSDTPIHIRKKQIEIVMAKSNEERLRMCFDMIDFSYNQAIKLLKRKLNTDDDRVAVLAYIEACYKDDIRPAYLEFIKADFSRQAIDNKK